MTDTTSITGRIDRALHRMVVEGYQPRTVTLGQAEQLAMADWLRENLPHLLDERRRTAIQQLPGMKYRAVQIICDDAPALLRVEGIWVDQICERAPDPDNPHGADPA